MATPRPAVPPMAGFTRVGAPRPQMPLRPSALTQRGSTGLATRIALARARGPVAGRGPGYR